MSTSKFEVIEHTVLGQHIRHYYHATAGSQEDELLLSVKQYKPQRLPKSGDVTIIAAPAVGLPKEVYEPLWDALFVQMEKQQIGIRGIWIADYVDQGASNLLNEGKLGNEPSVFDHSRDYYNLVNHFRREMPLPLVGIGHSLGGAVLTSLSLMHPRLFSSLSLVEPALNPVPIDPVQIGVMAVAFRKDIWPSRKAAMTEIERLPQYRSWEPRSLELFKQFGLVALDREQKPEGSVTLATSRHQEAFNIARSFLTEDDCDTLPRHTHSDADSTTKTPGRHFYNLNPLIAARLPALRPSCQYVYGGKSTWGLPSVMKNRKQRLEVTGTGTDGSGGQAQDRVVETYVKGGAHLIAQEAPEELANAMTNWFSAQLGRWGEEQAEQARKWDAVNADQKHLPTEEWRHWAKEDVKKYKEEQKAQKEAKKPKL
ncbi:Abhydrolase domain-containing protein mpaH [Pseudocercospora fuligena]|uniref:Abhydrolase domain-containing protein mpaH n=1 Tax=Pseudocercospora fuligena TaxID=685502 RepID=A0A8H6RAZ6_9PEZI|nr:Abhydrolase domain-containing protein mpaH [Pseudocercospora fuligena]